MIKPHKFWYAGLPLLALLLGACNTPDTVTNAKFLANTTEGVIEGTQESGVLTFKGIPYAAAPVGDLRWRAPRAAVKRSGPFMADHYGNFCAQPNNDMLWFELTTSSEDCLTLNVWTPTTMPEAQQPVMVWIHGGGYMQGSGNVPRLNGAALANKGVVLITINYRLNAFGFFAHPALSASQPDEAHDNFGLLDAIAALQWIKANAQNFGGDPNNVTIFGESAGGAMVNLLLVSPASEGLFHKAISQSSALGLAPDAILDQRSGFQVSGEAMGQKLSTALGLQNSAEPIAALRALPAATIVAAIKPDWRFTPVIDGDSLTGFSADIFAAGQQHDVPYITGGVSWEASLGRLIGGGFSPAMSARLVPDEDKARLYPGQSADALDDAIFGDLIILAQARFVANNWARMESPSWHYNMSYVADERRDTQPGVAHADDIAFVMRTLDADLQSPTANDQQMSDLMSAYWLQFARTGNPNHPDLPRWEAYTGANGAVMLFDDAPHTEENFLQTRMNYHIQRGEQFLQKVKDKVTIKQPTP